MTKELINNTAWIGEIILLQNTSSSKDDPTYSKLNQKIEPMDQTGLLVLCKLNPKKHLLNREEKITKQETILVAGSLTAIDGAGTDFAVEIEGRRTMER